MSPRVLVFAAPLVPVLLALITTAPRDQAEPASVVEESPHRLEPGGIRLRNLKDRLVEIELRTGLDADCSKGRLLAINAIPAGRSWTIHSSQPICFRQTGTAGPGEPARAWQRKVTERRTIEEVEL